MKNLQLLLFSSVVALCLFQACGDPCDDIICNYGGQCNEGVCECPPGYEGDACEIFSGSKLLGNFNISNSCDSTTTSLGIGFSTDNYATLIINNFHQPAENIKVNMTGETTFSIAEQTLTTDLLVSGTGTILSDGHFTVEYTVVNQVNNDTTDCSIEAIRQ